MVPPRRLNPAQRVLVHASFLYGILAYVAALTVLDTYRMGAGLWRGVEADRADDIAIRLVAAGVFFELRGTFRAHLVAKTEVVPRETHVSQASEIYGGYLTVVGLFVELFEGSRSLLDGVPHAGEVVTAAVVLLSALSLHVMSDFVRDLVRDPAVHASS
jgi:hypothetical protein